MIERLYIPKFLIKFHSKKAIKGNYAGLEKAIERARLPITTQELVAFSTFYSAIASVLTFLSGIIIFEICKPSIVGVAHIVGSKFLELVAKFAIISNSKLLDNFLISLYSYGNLNVGLVILLIFGIIFSIFIAGIVRYLILSYPEIILARRRGEIEVYLPHAVNMMYGMASGGISAYEMIKAVAEAKFMFGELSKEFETIVKLVELFDNDLITAINYVRETTPSEQLSGLLDDFVFILKGGGKLSSYLASKSGDLLQREEVGFSGYIEFLSLITETYLSVFILFPLFLLVILVVMKITGSGLLDAYVYSLYIILPISTLFFIYVIKSSMPVAPARLIKSKIKTENLQLRIGDVKTSFKIKRFKKAIKSAIRILLSPFKNEIYVVDVRVVSAYIIVFSCIAIYITRLFFPKYLLPVSLSAMALPFIAFIETRERKLRKIEDRIPEVFRELALLNEAGLTIIESLKILSNMDFGEITRELKIVRGRMEWGEPVTKAFKMMEERVRSEIMAKVIPVSVKVLEVSPTFKDAFHTVAHFANAEVMLRERIRSGMLLYVVMIYMAIFVFLIVIYVLIHNMFSAFHIQTKGVFLNIGVLKNTFYRVALLVSIFSGLIAGVIGNGKVTSGFKHSYIFLMATYILFNCILG